MPRCETIREVDILGAGASTWPRTPGKGDRYVLDLVKDVTRRSSSILNKIDLIKKSKLLPLIEEFSQDGQFAEIIPVSAATGDNVDRLEQADHRSAARGRALYPDDYLTDQPERFMAAEIVREKLLQFTHAEIPFSSAVVVDRFEEPQGRRGLRGCTARSSSSASRRSRSWSGRAAT